MSANIYKFVGSDTSGGVYYVMFNEPLVVLVDENDMELGAMPKLEAHRRGVLHRAISVFVFTPDKKMILQQRTLSKYHSGGLWSNTCCSHPLPGEDAKAAAKRRLFEEMGLLCELEEAFHFIYKADLENGLVEHEYDHVFIGETDHLPKPDPDEVAAWKALSSQELEKELATYPDRYTYWFREIYRQAVEKFSASGA